MLVSNFYIEEPVVEDTIEVEDEQEPMNEDEPDEVLSENCKNIVQWQVDLQYKKEQERLKIPLDPLEW